MLSKKETCWCADGCMRAPPSLDPAAREERSDAVDAELKALIFAHYLEKLARSPHQRDRMRRFVSRHVWEEEQALILSETYDALCARPTHPLPRPTPHSRAPCPCCRYDSFEAAHPDTIGRTKFIELRPWCIKKETCWCAGQQGAISAGQSSL